MTGVYWGDSTVRAPAAGGTGGFVERDGELYYRIANFHRMPPFFMTVVSGFDHWMFVSSTGGLTCGRRSPDHALFPYTTDDKIHDADNTTGPQTLLLVEQAGRTRLWKPFGRDVPVYALERNLYKNQAGNRLIFEEVNHDLGLVFSYCWTTGERFGFVRRSSLHNSGETPVRVRLLDGLRNILPGGVDRAMQTSMSTLVDAYKQAESHQGLAAAIFTLSSVPSDRAEPSEALTASVAWCVGLEEPELLLSEQQLAGFCTGSAVTTETSIRGRRGAFFVQASLDLAPGGRKDWYLVADVDQGPARLPALFAAIRQGVSAEALEQDIAAGSQRLLELAGGADGFQHTSDPLVTTRHLSNTLFNIMRGGTFRDDYRFPLADFLEFARSWNRPAGARFAERLEAEDGWLLRSEVLAAAESSGDPDLERLALEYLPLSFSRRHGDPSRPWNAFSIDIRNSDGSDRLDFQGNWRDIFQNWEALSISFPEFLGSFIAKFVNASTVDGYNPFRVSRAGFDWEILDAADPWSNIGYWGDHQVNYLVRLLELSRRYYPGELCRLFHRDIFVYADVPYRLKAYADLLADPRHTVEYDYAAAGDIARRVAELGSDGRLALRHDGSLCRVNLLEKLLLPALVKLGNFVPGGGIWMNTQRPEWNDANNALVGYGLSMVTLCYLRRYLLLMTELMMDDASDGYSVSREVLAFFDGLNSVFEKHNDLLLGTLNGRERKVVMDDLGGVAEAFRASVYAGLSGKRSELAKGDVLGFLRRVVGSLDHTIAGSRREDGLYHSYNLIRFDTAGYLVDRLPEMLEGQVAALNSGCLDAKQCLDVLDALRDSSLYRSDQNSYMLYPDRRLPLFLDKNIIAADLLADNAWLKAELESGRSRYVVRDVEGRAHFRASFRNGGELQSALRADPAVRAADADALCAVYEAVFSHRQFTGRSGAMYKYEGLGCIYWHMVSKLVLAVGEVTSAATRSATEPGLVRALHEHYLRLREGLGIHKTPAQYGAFPVDPYSHTPAFAGVQQPGMTGQVKEDVITRFLELGVVVERGEVLFDPVMLQRCEFLSGPGTWVYWAADCEQKEALVEGTLGFTLCGVPVIYRLAESAAVRVFGVSGEAQVMPGGRLDAAYSRSLFAREGGLRRIEVDLPAAAVR